MAAEEQEEAAALSMEDFLNKSSTLF